jgi:integrase
LSRRHFGVIRKRESGRWQILYWHEGERHSGGTFASKASAQSELARIETDLRRGVWIDAREGGVSVSEFSKRWLSHRADLAVRTRELYEYLSCRYIEPDLGRVQLNKLTPAKVREWNAELATRLPSTAAKSYRLLSTMMKTAVSDGLIVKSPCTIRGASIEHSPERPIASPSEVRGLANAMPERLRLVVILACWCQLRRGELLGLRCSDFNLAEATVNVERSRTFARSGRSIEKEPKTSAGVRQLSIPASLIPIIEEHIRLFCGEENDSRVFLGERGAPITAGVLQKAWSMARSQVGRPDLHFHDLRHSGLTFAAETGATTAELMHRAGHSSSHAALRYQHASRERDKRLASLLEEKMEREI